MANETFDLIQRNIVAPDTIEWRIDRPNVRERETAYPTIGLQPGDEVTIDAGGCVQTGGFGKTWKRYVDPQGDNTDRFYHGLIKIPGVHQDLVCIQDVLGQTFTIPPNADPNQLVLSMGYEDDHYDDNGYYDHDDGTGDQCKGSVPAWVALHVKSRTLQVQVAPTSILTADFTSTNPSPPTGDNWAAQVCNDGTFLINDPPAFAWTQVLAPADEFDNPPVGVTGHCLLPQLASSDLPFTHPFGNDWECFVAPDPEYQKFLAPDNIGGVDREGRKNDLLIAKEHAQELNDTFSLPLSEQFSHGVLTVESDAGLVPEPFRAEDGDRVAVLGRWIADCGHEHHCEIHPPLLFARARAVSAEETHSTIIGRPFLVGQKYADDGLPLRQHVINELKKAAIPVPFFGSLQIEAHPIIMPPFVGSPSMTYSVQPPPSAAHSLGTAPMVRFHFTVRSGVDVRLRQVDTQTVQVSVTMHSDQHTMPDLPLKHDRDVPLDDLGRDQGMSSELRDLVKHGLHMAADLVSPVAHFALANPLQTDRYDTPVAQSATDAQTTTVPVAQLPQNVPIGTVDDSQPYPIYGWLDVYWSRPEPLSVRAFLSARGIDPAQGLRSLHVQSVRALLTGG